MIHLKDSEVKFIKHKDESLLINLREVINEFFPNDSTYYSSLSNEDYRLIVHEAQEALNEKDFTRIICLDLQKEILSYIKEESFLIQSNLYLRAVRSVLTQDTESINWHRESFYGPNMEKSINIWTPIENIDKGNTLNFIPGSQQIPGDEIKIQQEDDRITRKGSTGNKIGFLYAPKKIIVGVDLNSKAPMVVPYHSSSIFPGNLIHGAGRNNATKIRFSVDFRIMPLSAYDPSKSKQIHLASGKSYFEPL